MVDYTFAAQVWAMASAAAVIVLGAVMLRGGASRPRGAVAFGLASITWGLQILFGHLAPKSNNEAVAGLLYLVFIATSLPVNYFLVEFALSYSPAGLTRRIFSAARWGVAGVGAATALILVFMPELLFGGVNANRLVAGPLFTTLVVYPQFVSFAAALVALYLARYHSPTHRTSLRILTLLAGLGIYVGFNSGYQFAVQAGFSVLFPMFLDVGQLALFGTLSATILAITAGLLVLASRSNSPTEARADKLVAFAIGLPFLWGLAEGFLVLTIAPKLLTVGLWRLAGVGVIAYGLARWRLFDLPQRATRTAATAAGASSSLISGVAVYGFGTLLTASTLLPALLGFAVVGATFIPGVRFARRLFENLGRGAGDETPDERLYGQRVESYRAALEASLARGSPEEDREFLDALRERFAISEAEDRLLRYYARSAVLVPKSGDTSAVYERLRLLGEGGAGRTWLARDRVRDRLVVLKEPLQKWQRESHLREQVLREARLAARVRHPHVITVEEVVEDKGLPVIVMEHLEGGSLADSLRERGVLPWREAIDLTIKVLRGVEAIHQAGIIHRDLKPSNVLLESDGSPKIADFGIAIPITSDKTVVAGSTSFSGTLSYVAPEVRAGSSGDRRSDVYSAAALLHECLHGSPPGPHAPVLALNEVPARVSTILARALHDDPAVRPQTARALADDLLAVVRS